MSNYAAMKPTGSSFLDIATVTAVLRTRLDVAFQDAANTNNAFSGVTVTTNGLGAIKDADKNKRMVNIFLYLVTPNPAWLNTDIMVRYPSTNPPASEKKHPPERLVKRPQVPLNLSYLFSFYGNETKLEPQLLLGKAVSVIHSRPRLTVQEIREEVKKNPSLSGSGLADQVEYIEHVTLSPINLNLEEMSKLWSVFFQVPYALSVAYQASTILIEPGEPEMVGFVQEVNIEPLEPRVPPKSAGSKDVPE